MAIQQSRTNNLQRPILIKKPTQVSLPEVEEYYFDRLAAFGLACLAAAIVGKLVMEALSKRE